MKKKPENNNEGFWLLSPQHHHADSPRLAKDGKTVVFLDNPVSTSDGSLVPGPQDMSRRLMKLNLDQGISASRQAAEANIHEIDIADIIVDRVSIPVTMHDGNTFYGLYPHLPLPDRCFSSDDIFYMTISQGASLQVVAIDINSKQV